MSFLTYIYSYLPSFAAEQVLNSPARNAPIVNPVQTIKLKIENKNFNHITHDQIVNALQNLKKTPPRESRKITRGGVLGEMDKLFDASSLENGSELNSKDILNKIK